MQANTFAEIAPGISYINNSGVVSSLSAPVSNMFLSSTGINTYTFVSSVNAPKSELSTGILQLGVAVLGGAVFPSIPVGTVGSATSVYDAAALVLSYDFLPYSQTSDLFVEYALTSSCNNSTVFANLYAIPSVFPNPIRTAKSEQTTSSNIYSSCVAGASIGNLGVTGSINFSVCAFNSGTGTSSCGSPNDYILVTEVGKNVASVLTASVTSTSATPVTLFTLAADDVGPFPQGHMVSGQVGFFDTANLIGSFQDFMFVLAYDGFNSTVSVGPAYSPVSEPSLTYSLSGNVLTVSVVGIASQTFLASAAYTNIVSVF